MLDHQKSFESAIVLAEKIVKDAFPIVGKHHTVQASNFRWQGVGSSVSYDIAAQKKAKLEDKSLLATLLADVEVVDKTGKVLDRRDGHIVLQIPHITSRASYILQGTERQVINQLRLRPGIYADFTPDNNIKVRINTSAAGTYSVLLDRESLVMTFRVGTSTNFPIISVLKILGLNEVEIRQLLGDKIFAVNQKKSKPDTDALKLIKKLRPYHATTNVDDAKKLVTEFLASKPLDPEVNKVTIGKPLDKVDQAAVVECVRKAISLATGASEPDDVESLAFKSILSFDDFVAERLLKSLPDIKRKVAALVDRKPQVLWALAPSTFTETIDNFFNKSEFTRHADQNNPIDIAAVNSLVTTMGEGGIKSTYAVTDEVRTIHPSHLGILDVAHTSEGGNIGITNHLSLGAKKIGSSLGMSVYDARTGKREDHTIQALVNKTIAYPDQYDNLGKGIPKPRSKEIKVRAGSSFKVVSPKEVDYVFTTPDSFFSSTTSAIPFLPNNHVNRVLMGDKHIEQAVNLTNPDKPLVMHEMSSGPGASKKISAGYEELFGQMFTVKAPVKGKVTKVTPDAIYIKPTRGKAVPVAIHNNYPLNSHTFFHDTPSVKVGDRVKEGQPLAESNFTKDNVLALGKNLRVAYTAYKGYNFEDGVVISEAAAQKLTSTHKHEYRVDVDKNTRTGADIFFAAFPQELKYLRDIKTRYDGDGVIKKGTTVEPGDILIPAFQQIPLHAEFDYKRLGKKLGDRAIDISQRWDGLGTAEVVDVVKSRSFIKVFLKSEEPMKIGDKISMRHGGKGIITHIVPDDQMYRDESGNVVDVLLNPLGVPSRVNTGQLFETAAGKLALKTGKPYYTKNFNETHGNTLQKIKDDLKAAGVKDAETLTDPVTGRKLPETLTGITHIYKLKHQVDTKFKARGSTDESYTLDEQPAKTDDSSAQRIGMLDTFSLLSGDATHFLNDAYGIKSQKNDEYWVALQRGIMPPPPKVPFITERFVTMLSGAGINLRQDGSKLTASPLTDAQIKSISHGEIDKPLVVKSTNLMPEKGGLFDPVKTGGIGGNRFNHIELNTPIPNPLMLDAITSVARLPKADTLNQIIEGNLAVIADSGEITKDLSKGDTHGAGIVNLLSRIDVAKEIARTQAEIKTAKAEKLNAAYRRLKYLRALKELKLTPVDAYTNKFVPIIPAKFRNVQPRTDGSLNVADANFGYREVIMINNQLKKLSNAGISQENLKTLNRDLFRAVSGVTGVTAPLTRAADVSGFIEKIKGPSPKMGFFQSRVLTRAQDLSARSTVIPNPKLGLDEIGLPTEMALTIYKPFVVKRLVGLGYDPLRARDLVEKKDELAIRALQAEVEERPAIMNRAPSLHKFNLQAFKPRLIEGRAVEVNPLIVAGYNMDFDGDSIDLDTRIPLKIGEKVHNLTGRELAPLLSVGEGNYVVVPKDMSAMTYDGWSPVAAISYHVVNKKKFEVTLKSGFSFIVSEDHSLMVGGERISAKDVQPGTRLDSSSVLADAGGDYAEGVILGNFLGDGCVVVRKNGSTHEINVACKPKAERDYLKSLWRETFGCYIEEKDREKFCVYDTELAKTVLRDCGKYAHGKFVGPELLSKGGEFLSGLLSGYILADGGVELTRSGSFLIRCWSNSKQLRDDMSLVCSLLGLPHSVRQRVTKGKTRYILSLGKEAIKLLDYRCPGSKGELLKVAMADYCHNRKDARASQSARNFEIESVREVEYTDRMLDIEVDDGSHVFSIGPGVVVHNTAGIHVPVSEDARKEAWDKLMPSRNLFSTREDSVIHAPSRETVHGLYLMTTPKGTAVPVKSVKELLDMYKENKIEVNGAALLNGQVHCAGQYLVDAVIPDQIKLGPVQITAKNLKDLLIAVAKTQQSNKASEIISQLKDLGNHYVTHVGFSVSLNDLEIDRTKRDDIMTKAKQRIKESGFNVAANEASKSVKDLVSKTQDNRFVEVSVTSGALGKLDSLAQMVGSPVAVEDHKGRVVPMLIEKSYAEGHDLGSYLATAPGARKGLVDKGLSVGETGYFNKKLVNTTIEYKIVSPDCRTTIGIEMPLSSSDIYDRFVAAGPYRNKQLTPEFVRQLVAKGKSKILVRSPMTCAAVNGLCQKCFGLDSSGKLPPIGSHIGALAGQTLGERATQTTLKAFHTGGTIGGPKLGFDRISELVELPDTVKNKATLASVSGAVSKIEETPTGGWFVYVKDTKHFVPKEIGLGVKLRQVVKAGDKLSLGGTIKPQELLEYTGSINTVRNYLVNELAQNYSKEQGAYIKRKLLETVVRPLTDKAQVTDAGRALNKFNVYPGDVLSVNLIKDYNKQLRVAKQPEIKFEPMLLGINNAPYHSQDFIGPLSHERLKQTIIRAPQYGMSTDIEKGHPMAQLALKNLRDVQSTRART